MAAGISPPFGSNCNGITGPKKRYSVGCSTKMPFRLLYVCVHIHNDGGCTDVRVHWYPRNIYVRESFVVFLPLAVYGEFGKIRGYVELASL